MKTKELINNQFLADKKWWIEETDKDYTLLVKHNGKVYQSKVGKDRIDYAKNGNVAILKKGWIRLLINGIELEVARDSIREFEKLINSYAKVSPK